MAKYIPHDWDGQGLERSSFMALTQLDQSWGPMFSMPTVALRFSDRRNAVGDLHGKVSRNMWRYLWPGAAEDDVPIGAITNGAHTGSLLARRMRVLFERSLGPYWHEQLDDPETWASLLPIPDEDLCAVHRHLKRPLQIFIDDRVPAQSVTTRYLS